LNSFDFHLLTAVTKAERKQALDFFFDELLLFFGKNIET